MTRGPSDGPSDGPAASIDRLESRNRPLNDEAIDWVVRLSSGRASRRDRAAFEAWRARSPAHAEAARAAAEVLRDVAATDAAFGHRETVAALRPPPGGRMTRRLVLGGGVAAAAGAAAVGLELTPPVSSWTADVATGVGERRTLDLADGARVWLNTGTALSLPASGEAVRILTGEALFRPAPGASRPLAATAGRGTVSARGGAFSIRRTPGRDAVTVVEGVAELRHPEGRLRLLKDQTAAFGDAVLGSVRAVDASTLTAWTRGKLIFNQRPLAEVAAELDRYRRGRVVVMGERLRAMQVSGVFDLDDPDALLRAVADTLSAQVLELPLLTVIR